MKDEMGTFGDEFTPPEAFKAGREAVIKSRGYYHPEQAALIRDGHWDRSDDLIIAIAGAREAIAMMAERDETVKLLGETINIRFIYPPTPNRDFDWQATYDDDEPDDNSRMRVGNGATKVAALIDLIADDIFFRGPEWSGRGN